MPYTGSGDPSEITSGGCLWLAINNVEYERTQKAIKLIKIRKKTKLLEILNTMCRTILYEHKWEIQNKLTLKDKEMEIQSAKNNSKDEK